MKVPGNKRTKTKRPRKIGALSQTCWVPMRDAADYFFFLGAAFFFAAFLVAFFID
jgi:hypothetical protein